MKLKRFIISENSTKKIFGDNNISINFHHQFREGIIRKLPVKFK
jgi:hypothetical protein